MASDVSRQDRQADSVGLRRQRQESAASLNRQAGREREARQNERNAARLQRVEDAARRGEIRLRDRSANGQRTINTVSPILGTNGRPLVTGQRTIAGNVGRASRARSVNQILGAEGRTALNAARRAAAPAAGVTNRAGRNIQLTNRQRSARRRG